MMFLFVSLQFCARASFSQHLAELQLPSASSYNYPKIAGKVGSPTGDFHPISSRPCWAYPKNPADHLKRATEDPGTAGDQGEENWATLLRNWLPTYFHIVTKGRILCENGYASPQTDVLVLHPSYPKVLLDKKLYLAGGVAAAFECKTTLKASHVKEAVETAANIRKNLPKREGTPYKELNSNIIYGLLAHSHSWKNDLTF